jgi:hypothetical protein
MQTIQLLGVTPTELVTQITEGMIESLKAIQQTPDQAKEILTRKDVAELFQVSLVCIHEWINKGILTPYKIGNRTFFKRSEVLETLYSSNRPDKV